MMFPSTTSALQEKGTSAAGVAAGAQGEAPCAAAEAGYLLASGVDFCRVEEINAVVVG